MSLQSLGDTDPFRRCRCWTWIRVPVVTGAWMWPTWPMIRRWRSPPRRLAQCVAVVGVLSLGACQTPSSPPSPATDESLAGPPPPASATSSRSSLLRRAQSSDGLLFPAKAGSGGHHHHGAPSATPTTPATPATPATPPTAPTAPTTPTVTPVPAGTDENTSAAGVDAGVTDTHQGHQP